MPDTWITPRVWVAGERITASKKNDESTNFRVLWPYTAAGQLAMSSASDDLGALQMKRQGGSATDWSVKGTTEYTPTGMLVQFGEVELVGVDSALATITFPDAFGDKPLFFVGPAEMTSTWDRFWFTFQKRDLTATNVKLYAFNVELLGTEFTIKASWMAIGPPA